MFQVKYQCKMRISYMPDCNTVPKVTVDFLIYPGNIAIIFHHIISHHIVLYIETYIAWQSLPFILFWCVIYPVLKIAARGTHVWGTKESLGGPKINVLENLVKYTKYAILSSIAYVAISGAKLSQILRARDQNRFQGLGVIISSNYQTI